MKHEVAVENAAKFAEWIRDRGGIAVWKSHDLSDPSASVSTPALTEGKPTQSPHWKFAGKPEFVVTDPADIEVYEHEVIEAFDVRLRHDGQGHLVLTDKWQRRVDHALAKAGPGSFYRKTGSPFMDPGIEICRSRAIGTLKDWMAKQPKEV